MAEPKLVDASFENALQAHDQLVANTGVEIWIGAEPTFADRWSTEAQWQTTALGIEKEAKAREFTRQIVANSPGCVVLRTLGRQYPGEDTPRWNLGVYSRRDNQPIWSGPPDPIVRPESAAGRPDSTFATKSISELRSQLAIELKNSGFFVNVNLPTYSWGLRLIFAMDAESVQGDWSSDLQITRPPIQSQPVPIAGTHDELASTGVFLVAIGPAISEFAEDRGTIQLELPDFGSTGLLQEFLTALDRAAASIKLESLILTGFPPPVDSEVAWTTVTPDPGVIEVNMAPCQDISSFYNAQRQLHGAAQVIGLSPYKLLFNGEVVDSGGGQHLTFGGSTPEASPFFQRPHLLPRLVAYLNRHPVLSYWFAVRSVGSCGQQPRADEVSPESLDGLGVSLERLLRAESLSPEAIWLSLAQFLCDRFGNTHRCEVNVEKLWNANSPARGCLGLVELRAFRMTRSAEDAAAIAVLTRTIVAWLASRSDAIDLVDWGSELHDRFSLPYYLLHDLAIVLDDLERDGFGLDKAITERLFDDSSVVIGVHDLGRARLTVRQALEFWPVVGQSGETEGSFRMMDSSTLRIELLLEFESSADTLGELDAKDWSLSIQGFMVPWVVEKDVSKVSLLRGVRYKAFHPKTTVSPLVEVIDPMEFCVSDAVEGRSWRVRLFNWQPELLPYDGMPKDLEIAQQRRSERMLVDELDNTSIAKPICSSAISNYCVDLRRINTLSTNSLE